MKDISPLFVRLLIYATLMFLISQVIASDFRGEDFTEQSLTEYTQEIILSIMVLGLGFFSFRYREFNTLTLLMALFFLVHLFRELDSFFDQNVFDGFWQIIVWTTVAIAAFITVKNFRNLIRQLSLVHNQFPFGVLLTGLAVLHVFSRFYGKTSNWKNLLDDAYLRTVKDASEESIELLGYTIILIGVCELMIFMRKQLN